MSKNKIDDRLRFRWYDKERGGMQYLQPQTGVKWMQCTGLKDKNGKLIFEGDILASYYHSPLIYGRRIVVGWDIDRWDYFTDTGRTCQTTESRIGQWWSLYEVIGNIHENPELANPPIPGATKDKGRG